METIRRLIRGPLGPDSPLYQAGAALLDFFTIVWKEGIRTWVTLRQLQAVSSPTASPVAVTFRNLQYPFLLRPETAEIKTVINNVVRAEYGQFQPDHEPQWMIDAGAFTGDTAAYFLSRFPNLQVIALEPNPASYELASQNLKPYGERARLLKKGLGATDERLHFNGHSLTASIQETGFEIDCTSVPTLLEQFSIARLDILKMDIEGSEATIFSAHPATWLGRVDLIIMELHGPDIQDLVLRTLRRNGYQVRRFRNVWYGKNDR